MEFIRMWLKRWWMQQENSLIHQRVRGWRIIQISVWRQPGSPLVPMWKLRKCLPGGTCWDSIATITSRNRLLTLHLSSTYPNSSNIIHIIFYRLPYMLSSEGQLKSNLYIFCCKLIPFRFPPQEAIPRLPANFSWKTVPTSSSVWPLHKPPWDWHKVKFRRPALWQLDEGEH